MFDADRIRIELCDSIGVSQSPANGEIGLDHMQSAEIWLTGEPGKIKLSRKPRIRLVGPSRCDVLYQIAGWLETHDDPGLRQLCAAYEAAKDKRLTI